MSVNIQHLINDVTDPKSRACFQALFDKVVDDKEANKTTFDGHHHAGTTPAHTPLDSGAAAVTFVSSLKK